MKPREPFFKPEDCDASVPHLGNLGNIPLLTLPQANRLVEPLLNLSTGLQSENNRLRDDLSQTLDDKTHLQTELLKAHSENERLRAELVECYRKLSILQAEIEEAPVVFGLQMRPGGWLLAENEKALLNVTHKARLVRIEEIGK